MFSERLVMGRMPIADDAETTTLGA